MPATSTANHPSGASITFTESDHSYIDNLGHRYTSGTAVVKRCFAPFNAVEVSAAMARRDGTDAAEIRAAWKAKGAAACRLGTRVHEVCEDALLGRPPRNQPESERERLLMNAGWAHAKAMLDDFDVLAVELIIFSPQWYVAGTVDILLRHKRSGTLFVADWKTNEKLRTEGYKGALGTGAAAALPDCEMSKYSLQLSIYEQVLRHEGYIAADAPVQRLLLHITERGVDLVYTSYLAAESAVAILDAATTGVPF
jgi:hypothetical protein